jgi:hypothetical protein
MQSRSELEQPHLAPAMGHVSLGELLLLEVLAREGPHHPDPGQVLLQGARHLRLGLVHSLEGPLDLAEELERESEDDRDERHRHHGQPPIEREHERERDQQHECRPPDLDHLAREELAQGLDVRGRPLHQIPGLRAVMERDRQMLEVVVDPIPHPAHDVFRRGGGQAPAYVRESTSQGRQEHHPDRRQPEMGAQEGLAAPEGDHPPDEGRALLRMRRQHPVQDHLRDQGHEVHARRAEHERNDRARVTLLLAAGNLPDQIQSGIHARLPDHGSGERGWLFRGKMPGPARGIRSGPWATNLVVRA